MKNFIALIMDPTKNPLMRLPLAQRYQVMLGLSVMWTTIFTASLGAWYLYGFLLGGHILVLLGIVATALVFESASKRSNLIYRDHPLDDGTARYDDVWGG